MSAVCLGVWLALRERTLSHHNGMMTGQHKSKKDKREARKAARKHGDEPSNPEMHRPATSEELAAAQVRPIDAPLPPRHPSKQDTNSGSAAGTVPQDAESSGRRADSAISSEAPPAALQSGGQSVAAGAQVDAALSEPDDARGPDSEAGCGTEAEGVGSVSEQGSGPREGDAHASSGHTEAESQASSSDDEEGDPEAKPAHQARAGVPGSLLGHPHCLCSLRTHQHLMALMHGLPLRPVAATTAAHEPARQNWYR